MTADRSSSSSSSTRKELALLLAGFASPVVKLASQEPSSSTGSVVVGEGFMVAFWLPNDNAETNDVRKYYSGTKHVSKCVSRRSDATSRNREEETVEYLGEDSGQKVME